LEEEEHMPAEDGNANLL